MRSQLQRNWETFGLGTAASRAVSALRDCSLEAHFVDLKKIKGPDNPTCYVFFKDVSSNVHTHVPCAPCMDAITEQVQRAFFIAGVANLLQPEPLINKTKQVRDILELSPSC